jgi:hypothetical protein
MSDLVLNGFISEGLPRATDRSEGIEWEPAFRIAKTKSRFLDLEIIVGE